MREQAGRSEEDKQQLLALNEALLAWQQKADTPEQLATIPVLPISEARTDPEPLPTEVTVEGDRTMLYHAIPTHGIVHLFLYFPLTAFTLEELSKLSLLPAFFGELPTASYSVAKLQQAIKTYIGELSYGISVFAKEGDRETCTPCLGVFASVLKENFVKAQELIAEILTATQWDEPERIREIVTQIDMETRQSAVGRGHGLGITAVQSKESARGAVDEAISGYTSIQTLHSLAKNYEKEQTAFLALLQRACTQAIGTKGMTLSVTATEPVDVRPLLNLLPEGVTPAKTAAYRIDLPDRMGIRIPAPISFAIQGYHLLRGGFQSHGSMWVAANILSLSYLWNAVRVQGGAYGTGLIVRRSGTIFCYSFRDPSPARSLNIYRGMSEYLREFCRGEENLDKFILSAVASTDPLQTPQERGLSADTHYFIGITEEERIAMRREIADTSREDLLSWCPVLDKMAEEGYICVVGPDAVLKDCPNLTVYDI
jgi:hypothetical protein